MRCERSEAADGLAEGHRVDTKSLSAILLLAGPSERSKAEDYVHSDRQGVWDGLVAAGVDKIL
jgi:hypothetical protein